jgi:hypothetical protein
VGGIIRELGNGNWEWIEGKTKLEKEEGYVARFVGIFFFIFFFFVVVNFKIIAFFLDYF